jgi:hypothetical protein
MIGGIPDRFDTLMNKIMASKNVVSHTHFYCLRHVRPESMRCIIRLVKHRSSLSGKFGISLAGVSERGAE